MDEELKMGIMNSKHLVADALVAETYHHHRCLILSEHILNTVSTPSISAVPEISCLSVSERRLVGSLVIQPKLGKSTVLPGP